MSQMLSAVVAGSKPFIDAVHPQLKMRLGAAPRVARDPQEALRVCADQGGLLVLEYAGSSWLEAVKNLRGIRGDAALSIVAAVPLAQAADVQPLQRAGVDEVVSWQGRVDPVIWAVNRIVDRQNAHQSDAEAPPVLVPVDEEEEAEKGFELREVPLDDSPAEPAPSAIAPSVPAPVLKQVASAPAVPWPNAVPSAADAEALLVSLVAGRAAGDASQVAAAERVLAIATDLERAALSGADTPVDPVVLRAVAALRVRLGIALASVSTAAAAGAIDQPAAQQLLAEVDGLLEQVKALAASAPAGLAPALAPLRLAVVEGGVKFAGALSQLVPLCEQQESESILKKQTAARVLSNEPVAPSPVGAAKRSLSRHIMLGIMLAVAAVLAGIYHARQFANRSALTYVAEPGMPANMFVVFEGNGRRILSSLDGQPPDAEALERYRQLERTKGNEVEVLGPTMLSVRALSPSTRPAPGR